MGGNGLVGIMVEQQSVAFHSLCSSTAAGEDFSNPLRLGLGGSPGGYSSHGYTYQASPRD